jgi:NYN domain
MLFVNLKNRIQTMKTALKHPLVAIYCDIQNVHLTQESATHLLTFAKSIGDVIHKKAYYNSMNDHQKSIKVKLQAIDITLIDVPCSLTNSADNKIKADLIEDSQSDRSPDTVILVSGDGDFEKHLKCLQEKGKSVIVLAQRRNVNKKLTELADRFHFIDELPHLVKITHQRVTHSIESQIDYTEAVNYLTIAIKTALSQGKRTVFGYVNKLMRQLFPQYQGVSYIRTPDGRKFAQFSQFVKAVVNEGKIKIKNEELLLIE